MSESEDKVKVAELNLHLAKLESESDAINCDALDTLDRRVLCLNRDLNDRESLSQRIRALRHARERAFFLACGVPREKLDALDELRLGEHVQSKETSKRKRFAVRAYLRGQGFKTGSSSGSWLSVDENDAQATLRDIARITKKIALLDPRLEVKLARLLTCDDYVLSVFDGDSRLEVECLDYSELT